MLSRERRGIAEKYNGVGSMQDNRAVQRDYEPEMINIRRNPYLEDYGEQRRRAAQRQQSGQPVRRAQGQQSGQVARRSAGGQMYRNEMSGNGQPVRRAQGQQSSQVTRRTATGQMPGNGMYRNEMTRSGQPSREAVLRARRRRQVRRQKIAVGIWAICIIAISGLLFLNRNSASAAEPAGTTKDMQNQNTSHQDKPSTATIQGLPVEKFTAHPEWTENFLTTNEYSRPGEALPEVKDVFVHYTANPGTSAAQNRSYFEQQKDVHMASVSAHFIIGYEGEIIQCVPLDEIAYAVQSRNYDSVSIECCYKAKDGSFTQETYDSLIALLAWLTDVYDLDTDHILRHYDCGGKKCPIYYTEHEDAWEQLKQDVKAH